MARHHTVPQMYVRRFADARNRVLLAARDDPSQRHLSSVKNACCETDFYAVDSTGADAQIFETLLSKVETKAAAGIDELLSSGSAGSSRHALALFLAIQRVRGPAFRRRFLQVSDAISPTVLANRHGRETYERLLRDAGYRDADVSDALNSMSLDGDIEVMTRAHPVTELFVQAMQQYDTIYQRIWRVLEFAEPCLISSDEPLLTTPPDHTATPLDAPDHSLGSAMWIALDRQHALALTRSGSEGKVRSGPVRARMINKLAAEAAERWIVCHPDDARHLPTEAQPPLQTFVTKYTPTSPMEAGRIWIQPVRRT